MQKTKSIQNLETKMEALDPASLRYKVLDSARNFKSSWIDLGQYLYSVYKDKLFKDWGYLTFEAYSAKEIGIRQPTAMKLLKSYSFLEREEPAFLKRSELDERKPAQIPGYETVNALRIAKESERVPEREYENLREEVLQSSADDEAVKKKIRYVLKKNSPAVQEPVDEEKKKEALIRKLLVQLKTAKDEMEGLEVSDRVLSKIDELMRCLLSITIKGGEGK